MSGISKAAVLYRISIKDMNSKRKKAKIARFILYLYTTPPSEGYFLDVHFFVCRMHKNNYWFCLFKEETIRLNIKHEFFMIFQDV